MDDQQEHESAKKKGNIFLLRLLSGSFFVGFSAQNFAFHLSNGIPTFILLLLFVVAPLGGAYLIMHTPLQQKKISARVVLLVYTSVFVIVFLLFIKMFSEMLLLHGEDFF